MSAQVKSALNRFTEIAREEGPREALIRAGWRIGGRLYSQCVAEVWERLPRQEDLLAELFGAPFTLIILDACRHDYFTKDVYGFLEGDLKPVRSPASHTLGWLKAVIPPNAGVLRRAMVYSANPQLNSKEVPMDGFMGRDYMPDGIVDLWQWAWDPGLGTVPPSSVVRAVRERGLKERNIVWFIQPHFPYIGKTRVMCTPELLTRGSVLTINRYLARQVRKGFLSPRVLERAYRDNLLLVLEAVSELLEITSPPGRVVVTSDHGELLGEYGIYSHPDFVDFPEQRIVPWFEIS